MNKIFRIVWNYATQSWVAVSELTKSHKKSGSSNLSKVVIVTSLLVCFNRTVLAEIAIGSFTSNNGTITTNYNNVVAVGGNSRALGDGTVAIGEYAGSGGTNGLKDYNNSNVLIGKYTKVGLPDTSVSQSIAIGGGRNPSNGAWAQGTQSIAIGGDVLAKGDSSIAIGGDDVVRAVAKTIEYTDNDGVTKTSTIKNAFQDLTGVDINKPLYTPTTAEEASIAVGMKASAKDLAVALGTLATASKVNTIAIGSGAKADVDNAIAIGGGSDTAKHGTKQTKTEITGLSYGWSGGDKTGIGDIVSIGSAGYERQLKNLAAGEVSETSTDGINGSQLFGVIKDLTNKSLLRYSADNAKDQTRDGDDVLKQSLVNNRLEILGGADKDKLSDNNIGVNAQDGKIHVKLSKELNDLTSTNVSGVVTNASGIAMGDKKITGLADGTDAHDAVNKGQLDKLGNNTFKLGANNNTETDAQALNKEGGLKFDIQGNNGLTASATGSAVTIGLDTDTKAKIDNAADKDLSNITDAGKNKIKEQITWKAKGTSTEAEVSDADKANDTDGTTVGADGTLTLDAGKNLRLKHDTATNTFTYALNKTLTDITSIGGNGTTITFSDKGADLGGKKLTNLGDGTDAGDAVNKGQLDKLGNNTFKLVGNNNTETDAQALNKENGLKFNVQGDGGLVASAKGNTVTLTFDEETKAKLNGSNGKIGNNHISFEGNNGTTDQQNLDKADGMKFLLFRVIMD